MERKKGRGRENKGGGEGGGGRGRLMMRRQDHRLTERVMMTTGGKWKGRWIDSQQNES
jgi:hypothetical protein